ncbi:sulfide-dependent adenosine diphosphate thiazole synthase [bacterium]
MIEDKKVSQLIANTYFQKLEDSLSADVIIVGAGPSGLVAGGYLAKKGLKVNLIERKGSLGGGIWGGAMMFNEVVIQKDAVHILEECEIRYTQKDSDYVITSSPLLASGLSFHACRNGVKVFNFVSAEDVMINKGSVTGVVINWTAVKFANLHVDPLAMMSDYVIDGTGHECQVVNIALEKLRDSSTGKKIIGERSLNADIGEQECVENSCEVIPGLYVMGMAANAYNGGHRMGPIFGGMLLSGEKVAKEILEKKKQPAGKK